MIHTFNNKVDFYITNVCNHSCDNCNRFNNHHFTGWQRWSDYADIYTQWSKKVRLKSAVIMGGEPTLNPTLADWVRGLSSVFGVDVQVLTNGTRLLEARGLYEAMQFKGPNASFSNHIGISIHNLDDFEEIRYNVTSFLQGSIQEWGKILNRKPPHWLYPDFGADYSARDQNGVLINAWICNTFVEAAVMQISPGKFALHDNDAEQTAMAFHNCSFAKYRSYHFIRGKLYRCAPAALMPEFDQQYPFDLTVQDRELLYAYQPLSMENYDRYAEHFFRTIDDPIPQCKFCSPKPEVKTIFPIRKGMVNNDAISTV